MGANDEPSAHQRRRRAGYKRTRPKAPSRLREALMFLGDLVESLREPEEWLR